MITKILNSFPYPKLQVLNRVPEVMDVIFQNIKLNCGKLDLDERVKYVINTSVCGDYNKIINSSLDLFKIIIKHSYGYTSIESQQQDATNALKILSDDRFNNLIQDLVFAETLLVTNFFHSFIKLSSNENIITNQVFSRCINNKDLILISCCIYKGYYKHKLDFLKYLMLCSDRKSMIDKLYNLQQEDKLYCNKESLDLILANLPVIQQLIYNDVDGSVLETLQGGDYEKVETLIHSANLKLLTEAINEQGNLAYYYTGGTLLIKPNTELQKLETISAMEFIESGNQEHLMQDYKEKYNKYKELHVQDVEEKAKQRETKLGKVQITLAISEKEKER